MPRRRPLPPDTRPDWRNPNLRIWVSRVNRWVTPEEMQRAAQKGVANLFVPPWNQDPTYNLRKDRR